MKLIMNLDFGTLYYSQISKVNLETSKPKYERNNGNSRVTLIYKRIPVKETNNLHFSFDYINQIAEFFNIAQIRVNTFLLISSVIWRQF